MRHFLSAFQSCGREFRARQEQEESGKTLQPFNAGRWDSRERCSDEKTEVARRRQLKAVNQWMKQCFFFSLVFVGSRDCEWSCKPCLNLRLRTWRWIMSQQGMGGYSCHWMNIDSLFCFCRKSWRLTAQRQRLVQEMTLMSQTEYLWQYRTPTITGCKIDPSDKFHRS